MTSLLLRFLADKNYRLRLPGGNCRSISPPRSPPRTKIADSRVRGNVRNFEKFSVNTKSPTLRERKNARIFGKFSVGGGKKGTACFERFGNRNSSLSIPIKNKAAAFRNDFEAPRGNRQTKNERGNSWKNVQVRICGHGKLRTRQSSRSE